MYVVWNNKAINENVSDHTAICGVMETKLIHSLSHLLGAANPAEIKY